jgi:hypothetical protein
VHSISSTKAEAHAIADKHQDNAEVRPVRDSFSIFGIGEQVEFIIEEEFNARDS